jgi:multiple sugar transport system permease protein
LGISVRTKSILARTKTKENLEGWLFIAPLIIGYVVFLLGPLVSSVWFSFTEWNLLTPPRPVGLSNYQKMLFEDAHFWRVMLNTAYFTFATIPLGIVVSLAIALLVNQNLKGMTFFRGLYFMPVVTSWIAVGLAWRWLYNPEFGLVNWFLSLVGIKGPLWLNDTVWAMPAVILVNVWKGAGYNMVLYLAGLQGIPEQLYEASQIDGANRWQKFWHITLPLLSPTTFFILVTSVIGSFQIFAAVYIMTSGGPAGATEVIVYYLWENAFNFLKMGYASALAWALFVVVLAFTLLQWRFSKRWVFYA